MFLNPLQAAELFIKGLIVGIIASAPMGPVGILVVQRTLNKGRWHAFVTGLGAAVSDLLYALFTALGMSLAMALMERNRTVLYLKLAGAVMLFVFGLGTSCGAASQQESWHAGSQYANGIRRNAEQSAHHLPLRGAVCALRLRGIRVPA